MPPFATDAPLAEPGEVSTATSEPDTLGWSEMYAHRRRVAKRFGRWFQLPLVKRVEDVVVAATPPRGTLLEVGAGARKLATRLIVERPDSLYESMDIDAANAHDYHDLAEIERTYDCVVALEVIEHLSIDAIPDWLASLAALLKPGGRLVVSTPNTFYPPAYLRDATHRTPLAYDELGGLIEHAGLDVEQVARVYNDAIQRRVLRRYVFGWLFRLLGLDYAPQIVVVATRRS